MCDGPDGHDGGCTLERGSRIIRRLEARVALLEQVAEAAQATHQAMARFRDPNSHEPQVPPSVIDQWATMLDGPLAALDAARREDAR